LATNGFPIGSIGMLHGRDDSGRPRSLVAQLFGYQDVYLTPEQMRLLGRTLLKAADDCERLAIGEVTERDGWEYDLF